MEQWGCEGGRHQVMEGLSVTWRGDTVLRAKGGPGGRQRARLTVVVTLSCLTLVTLVVLLFYFQSLSEKKIQAQKNWVSQQDHGTAGLSCLCPKRPDCFPGSAKHPKMLRIHRASVVYSYGMSSAPWIFFSGLELCPKQLISSLPVCN